MIFPEQVRAARALLGWKQNELADAAKVGVATIRRIEGVRGTVTGAGETLWKIQKALEAGGVEFIVSDDVKGPGVRLKKPLDI